MKLFREWSAKWPEDFKIELKEKVLEIDPTFEERLCAKLNGVCNGIDENAAAAAKDDADEPPHINGHHSHENENELAARLVDQPAVVQPLLIGVE